MLTTIKTTANRRSKLNMFIVRVLIVIEMAELIYLPNVTNSGRFTFQGHMPGSHYVNTKIDLMDQIL